MPVEFAAAETGGPKQAQLMDLVKELVKYCLDHHAEAEACDLLMEIEHVELLLDYVTEDDHNRVCLYLSRYKITSLCVLLLCVCVGVGVCVCVSV